MDCDLTKNETSNIYGIVVCTHRCSLGHGHKGSHICSCGYSWNRWRKRNGKSNPAGMGNQKAKVAVRSGVRSRKKG